MKKQLLIPSLILLTTGLYASWSDNPAADSSRNACSIPYVDNCIFNFPVIDGIANDGIWSIVDAVPIDRMYTNGNAGARPINEPTFNSCWFKAFYTDTVIYVLVQATDDSFWPAFMVPDKANSYKYDKVELYFGVNGISKSDHFGASTGATNGCYQITADFDTIGKQGIKKPANFPNTWMADKVVYNGTGSVVETSEWSINMKVLTAKGSTTPLDPTSMTQILFDVSVADADSAKDLNIRRRQIWSNIGHGSQENWSSMDSAGVLTFGGGIYVVKSTDCVPVRQISSEIPGITPSLASTFINIPAEISRIEIINIMGCTVLQANNDNGTVDISMLNKGIYYVRIFSNSGYLGNQKILKY
jgi:hypothetical protein